MTSLPFIVEELGLMIPGPPGLGISAGQLTAITDDITALEASMTTAQTDINAAEADIVTLETQVASLKSRWVSIPIDGGGSVISTGVRARAFSPADGVITGWRLVADQSGSIVINLWERVYPNIPTVTQQITGGTEKPTLSTAQVNEDLSLAGGAGWAINDGYNFWVNVESVTTCTYVALGLRIAWND